MQELELFLLLANNTNLYGKTFISTSQLSKQIKLSQQSISRKLIELEIKGLIYRKPNTQGIEIQLTKKGINSLKEKYLQLKKLFDSPTKKLKGTVISGLGEGAYYIKIYNKLFKQFLGFKAFHGTLNLQVDEVKAKNFLQKLKRIYIPKFKDKERTFGGVSCYLIKIQKTKGAIIVPDRTRHSEKILEIISPINLRKKFSLEDDKKLEITKEMKAKK